MAKLLANTETFYKESKDAYDNNILECMQHIVRAIPYYISRINELETELDLYKKAYENRANDYLNDNHIPHID